MKVLFIFLQFGASVSEPLSTTQLSLFWGIVLLLAALFVYFLIRTNRIVAARSQSRNQEELVTKNPINKADADEETAAAIALAMHMYKNEMHDRESFTITLKKVSKIYSPWSSKIYTLRQNPR